MLNIIIKAVFWIVGKIGDIILLPIMGVINLLLPGITVNLDYIFDYLEYGFNYLPYMFKLFMIPPFCIQIVVIVFSSYISLVLGVRVYNFIMLVYEKFKP